MKQTAVSLPIVCPAFSDAFIPNLAASFAYPGGSVTGIASDVEGLIGKLTELTLDAIPSATKIGFLANSAGGSMARFEQQVQKAAQARGVEVRIEHLDKLGDLEQAFHQFSEEQVRSIIVPPNGLLSSGRKQIIELAMASHLPLIFSQRDGVDAGGLASYGINIAESYGRAATYVDKILKGAAPGDLPIEFSTKLDLIINLKAAKKLDIAIPAALLSRADEVIE
jgi:putative ABC transport system substrate-binding protein